MSIPRTDTTGRISTILAPRVALPLAFALSIAWPAPARAQDTAPATAGAETVVPAAAPAPASPVVLPAPAPGPENPFGRKYLPRDLHDRAADREAARHRRPARRRGVAEAGRVGGQLHAADARPRARRRRRPTELKILYDDKHLYFAIRAYDDPAKIHLYPGRRDDFGEYAVDIVGICFDSYNDKRTGFEFDLTAGGGKIDLILGNGETEWDTTWDAVWDGKVAHDEKGWTAEFRIPLNQLRYGTQKEQVWGMHAWRWLDPQPGGEPVAAHPAPEHRAHVPARRAARHPRPAAARGTSSCCRTWSGRRPPARPSPARTRTAPGTIGLDAKLGLTTNFTLDATVNPDFGQVEADPSVLNLTAYETFYEEKRPFFLEGRKILKFDDRGRGPALLLAPRRPAAVAPAARRAGRDGARARRARRSSGRSR